MTAREVGSDREPRSDPADAMGPPHDPGGSPTGSVTLIDADAQHREVRELLAELVRQAGMIGLETMRLDAAAAPVPQSQHVRFRVYRVIVNPVTAGTLTLTIGTATYPFDGSARSLQDVPFPIVIERGSDISCVGADGRIFLIGKPE
jgi:hypothetical protein